MDGEIATVWNNHLWQEEEPQEIEVKNFFVVIRGTDLSMHWCSVVASIVQPRNGFETVYDYGVTKSTSHMSHHSLCHTSH